MVAPHRTCLTGLDGLVGPWYARGMNEAEHKEMTRKINLAIKIAGDDGGEASAALVREEWLALAAWLGRPGSPGRPDLGELNTRQLAALLVSTVKARKAQLRDAKQAARLAVDPPSVPLERAALLAVEGDRLDFGDDCMSLKRLQKILALCPDADLYIVTERGQRTLRIRGTRYMFRLTLHPADTAERAAHALQHLKPRPTRSDRLYADEQEQAYRWAKGVAVRLNYSLTDPTIAPGTSSISPA